MNSYRNVTKMESVVSDCHVNPISIQAQKPRKNIVMDSVDF